MSLFAHGFTTAADHTSTVQPPGRYDERRGLRVDSEGAAVAALASVQRAAASGTSTRAGADRDELPGRGGGLSIAELNTNTKAMAMADRDDLPTGLRGVSIDEFGTKTGAGRDRDPALTPAALGTTTFAGPDRDT